MEVIILIAIGGGVVWLAMYAQKRARIAALRTLAVDTKRKLVGDDGDAKSNIFGHVLKYCNARADLNLDYIFYLTNSIDIMLKNSDLAPDSLKDHIDTLIDRIDRGLEIQIDPERRKLEEFETQQRQWITGMEQFIDCVLPLFPENKDEQEDEDFVGEVIVQKTNLLERASNPHEFLLRIGNALAGIDGTFIRRDELPIVSDMRLGKGDPKAIVLKNYGRSLLPELLLNVEIETRTRIPFVTRFEHTHVLGGTGHGKTQFLQSLILKDIHAALEDKGSIVVIDGQGDLIRKITSLAYFDPDAPNSLADKLVLIDANDVDHPVCINMFAQDEAKLASYDAADRERIFNATISLYEYFFGALLGADLTQRQGVIFKFLARLMFVIPDATIHTLLDVMENGDDYRMYIDRLDPTAQRFFREQFFNKAFDETKQQIATRLWGIISNGTLNRIFSNTENKFDFFDAINSGKIVLINTAKDMLQADGNAILGRFFIALFARAVIQRQVLPEDARRACFAYIDEVQDYIQNDNKIEDILNQARKYKAGLLCAHQNLDQLSKEQRASFAASTSTKYVGGLSAKDATKLAGDMRTSDDFLLSAKKASDHTNFACFVKNVTPSAIMMPVEFGQMESVDLIDPAARERLISLNRERYCVRVGATPPPGSGPRPETEKPAGDGGFNLGEHDVI